AVTIEYRFTFSFKPPPAPPGPPPQAPVNFRGLVLERPSRKPIVGADVEVLGGKLAAVTDAAGRFEIRGVPDGQAEVTVIAPGYVRFASTETLRPGKVTEVTYHVLPHFQGAYETVVTGMRDRKEVSEVAISAGEIRQIPGIAGDTVKVVQSLPGVARAPFGS